MKAETGISPTLPPKGGQDTVVGGKACVDSLLKSTHALLAGNGFNPVLWGQNLTAPSLWWLRFRLIPWETGKGRVGGKPFFWPCIRKTAGCGHDRCLKNKKALRTEKEVRRSNRSFFSPGKERTIAGRTGCRIHITPARSGKQGLVLFNVFTTNVYCERIRQILITTKCYFH